MGPASRGGTETDGADRVLHLLRVSSRAAGLAENLLHDYDEQLRAVTIAPGETGSFEVFLNRRKVFSKHALDRFPEVNEVEEKIGELVGA